LLTAFLERFFERYVSYDFTAHLEDELDDISGGRTEWRRVLEQFWKDFKPKTAEIMEQKPSDITAALDDFLAPWLFPDKGDGSDPRLCPACGEGRLGLRGGRYGAFVACSNYPDCKFTRRFGADSGEEDQGPQVLGENPETGQSVSLRSGRFGPYVQLGDGKEAKRSSLPKDVPSESLDLDVALRLLSLPRTVGNHPESGKPITASIGRYGPYLAHDGKYAKLGSTAEVFEVGMNAAVAKLADAAAGGGRARGSREPLRVLGAHPTSGAEIRLMEGRFGPYVTDGTTNATLARSAAPDALTLEEAAQLIDDRAAKGPAKKKGRRAPAKAAARKKKS
jgi:DNA topoisomerase-1